MAVYKAKNDAGGYELADVGTRFIALFIDNIIVGIVANIIGAVLGRVELGFFLQLLLTLAYQWYFLTQRGGQTIGKQVLGIRVIKTTGEPLTAADAVIRTIGYYINSLVLLLGWIWALFDENKQGWHDKLASTYVVKG